LSCSDKVTYGLGVPRAPRILFLTTLLGAELGAVAVLRRLGRVTGFSLPRHGAAQWIVHAPREDLFAVTARLVGLGLAWWLLAATALSITRRVVPGCRRLRSLDAFTPVALRRRLDRALALGLGASLGLASIHPTGAATLDVPVPRVPTSATTTTATTAPAAPASAPTTPSPHTSVVVVRAGDNLWVIAERALRATGQQAGTPDVAAYWRRVIAANTAHLRSHDPNLIFPGERVVLPPNDSARG
jgi:LysM domain